MNAGVFCITPAEKFTAIYPAYVLNSHRFMQDNDPKHMSRTAKAFFEYGNINWWKTPPESPDLNPIENLWHELREYIRCEVKTTQQSELIAGITQFWDASCFLMLLNLMEQLPVTNTMYILPELSDTQTQ